MRNKKEIYNIYINQFAIYKSLKSISNKNFVLTDWDILESIRQTKDLYECESVDLSLSAEELNELIKKIKSRYEVYQEEGSAILGDYKHDYKWHEKLLESKKIEPFFWDRYKNYLLDDKQIPANIVETMEDKTLNSLMSYIGNPHEEESKFSIRGLVVGDVQSGKTANYVGLITQATDAGYKLIFVLTGVIESLRRQTQIRAEEGFIGWDSVNGVDVGVKRGDKIPMAFTSREKDFTGQSYQNTTCKISDDSIPMIFVVKKNTKVLKKIYRSIKQINTLRPNERIKYPMLMIDDEADNASINTNKPEDNPTKINEQIRNILNLFERTTYVGFTATPFANVFISYDDEDEMLRDDLFPRDFIYALKAPSNYYGSKKYFFEENDNVQFITDYDEKLFPMKHKKTWEGDHLFGSFYHAINSFLLINAIRDYREEDQCTDRSMLINMSRFTRVQEVIKGITEKYFDRIKKDLKQTRKYELSYALTNSSVMNLKESFDREFKSIKHDLTFEDIFPLLYESIKNIKIQVVNSLITSEKLEYNCKSGTRVIAIGGLALSRGLTLEGLCVSYFYRNTATFDVLMQMGRWFGYREGYADLCRIFLTSESAEYYKDVCRSIECLKDDIDSMSKQHKKPKDFGIRVRNDSMELRITAANKSRGTKSKMEHKSYFGNIFETPYLHRDLDVIEENINSTITFLRKINPVARDVSICQHPYFRNIPKRYVINLLQELKIHEANESFDTKQIDRFLQRSDKELEKFDILVIGGASEKHFILNELNIDIPLIVRRYDIQGNNVIRMSAQRAHLWGRYDTKFGLTKKEQESISENARAQDFLIKGRNPLLIIYFIEPKNEYGSENYDYKYGMDEGSKLSNEMATRKYKFLIGYAIGFPHKDGETADSTLYIVNKTVDYYKKDHEFMGVDCNE